MIFVKLIDGTKLESKGTVNELRIAMRKARGISDPFIVFQETWINVHCIVQYGEVIDLGF